MRRQRNSAAKPKRFTLGRLFAFIIMIIMPMATLFYGLKERADGLLPNTTFTITFIAIPLITVLVFAVNIFSRKGAFIKILENIFIFIAFVIVFAVASVLGSFEGFSHSEKDDISDNYAQICRNFEDMPTLEELGNYTALDHYHYYSTEFAIFRSDANTLIVEYSADDYGKELAKIYKRYVFEEGELFSVDYTCQSNTQLAGYTFNVVCSDASAEHDERYPFKFMLIGTNEDENTVAYITFYDDTYYGTNDLNEFILTLGGWNHILNDPKN